MERFGAWPVYRPRVAGDLFADRVVTYENLQFGDNLPTGPQGPRKLVLVPLGAPRTGG
jgi:hypothetical protein